MKLVFKVFLSAAVLAVSNAESFGDSSASEDITQLSYEFTFGEESQAGAVDAKTSAHLSPMRRAIHLSRPSIAQDRIALTPYHWRPSVNYPSASNHHHHHHLPTSHPKQHHVHTTDYHYTPKPASYHPPKPVKPLIVPVSYTPTAYPEFPPAGTTVHAAVPQSPPPPLPTDFPVYVPDDAHHGKDSDGSGGDGDDSSERPKQPRDYFPPPSVIGVLEDEEATTFLSLLERVDLLETLEEDGTFTVFAPTNQAFSNMDQETIDTLTNDEDLLESVLKYHIVPEGKIFTKIIKDDLLAPTLEGTDLRLNKNDELGYITANGAEVNSAKSDQRAANGVVQFLNEVIYPVPVGSIYNTLEDDSRYTVNAFFQI